MTRRREQAGKAAAVKRTGGRVALYYTLLALSPIVLLLFLEGALRLAGFGYDPALFVRRTVNGVPYWEENRHFSYRFFPEALARPFESARLPFHKAPGEIRIFVLGESAAEGDPSPAFSFSRQLQTMIDEACPGRTFTIINAGITAINSHAVYAIATECAKFSPDLFIVYMGNNEVIGPYGPGTVGTPALASVPFIRFSSAVRATKIGQLVRRIASRFQAAGSIPAYWGGMRMFTKNKIAPADPRMTRVYESFSRNLKDICSVASCAGAEVLLCSVASNCSDCAPFCSLHRAGLSGADSARWEAAYQHGIELFRSGRTEDAIGAFKAAAALDSTHAELEFLLGSCCAEQGRPVEAQAAFVRGRDNDALRFRADTKMNDIVRTMAKRRGVLFADLLDTLRRENGGIGPGRAHFLEHVHLTFEGNYAVARALFSALASSGFWSREGLPRSARPLSMEECRRRLGFTPWERLTIYKSIRDRIAKPPFTGQLGHAAGLEATDDSLAALTKAVSDSGAAIDSSYREALRLSGGDWVIRQNFAMFLAQAANEFAAAAEEFRNVLAVKPMSHTAVSNLATCLNYLGDDAGAIECLKRSIEIEPYNLDVCINYSRSLGNLGKNAQALAILKKAERIGPDYPPLLQAIGERYKLMGRYDQAADYFGKAREAVARTF